MDKIEIIKYIIVSGHLIAFAALINALLTYLLQFCFMEGSIFSGWLPFVAKIIVKAKNPVRYKVLNQMPKKLRQIEFINEAIDTKLYKILGGCDVCSNIWQAVFLFCILNISLDIFTHWEWFWLLPFLLFSSFILRKINT